MPHKRDKEAFEIIDALGAKLLELTANKPLPRDWKKRLTAALKPTPKKPGRPFSPEQYASIVRDLDAARGELREGFRTGASIRRRSAALRRIAEKHKFSRKSVEAIEDELRAANTGAKALRALNAASPARAAAMADGISKALEARMNARAPWCSPMRKPRA